MNTKEPPQPIPLKTDGSTPAKAGQCFTMMPFGGYFDRYYKMLYVPAIEAAGLKPVRVDGIFTAGNIVKDIWRLTRQAKVCLADLTGRNANVFYEMGLAHAIAKPVVLLAQSTDDIPYDLQSNRVIIYDRNEPDWAETLKARITQSLQHTLVAPIDAILPAFLDVKDEPKHAVTQEEKDILQIKQTLSAMAVQIANLQDHSGLADLVRQQRGITRPIHFYGGGEPKPLNPDVDELPPGADAGGP